MQQIVRNTRDLSPMSDNKSWRSEKSNTKSGSVHSNSSRAGKCRNDPQCEISTC